MNSRSSDRCGAPSFRPPFSLRSGGSIRARRLSMPLNCIITMGRHVHRRPPGGATPPQRTADDGARHARRKDQLARLIEEAEALDRAISAFHLEGIRFRIYNVDRIVQHPPVPLPPEARRDRRGRAEAPGSRGLPHAVASVADVSQGLGGRGSRAGWASGITLQASGRAWSSWVAVMRKWEAFQTTLPSRRGSPAAFRGAGRGAATRRRTQGDGSAR